jgi:hypothetical protein
VTLVTKESITFLYYTLKVIIKTTYDKLIDAGDLSDGSTYLSILLSVNYVGGRRLKAKSITSGLPSSWE